MLANFCCFQTPEPFRFFSLLNLSKTFKTLHLLLKMATYLVRSFWHHELEFPARSHNRLQDVLPILQPCLISSLPTRLGGQDDDILYPLQESDGGGQ